MAYSDEDFKRDLEMDFLNARNRTEQKEKIRALMDKYGETREEIEAKSTMTEWMEFIMSDGDALLDDVRRERSAEKSPAASADVSTPLRSSHRQTENNAGAGQGAAVVVEEEEEEEETALNQASGKKAAEETARNQASEKKAAERTALHQANGKRAATQSEALTATKPENSLLSENEMSAGNAAQDNPGRKSGYNEQHFIDNVMRPVIEKNEGIYAYPYLDTAGNVTVGPGINVETNSAGIVWYLLDPQTGKTRRLYAERKEDLAIIKKELANLDQYKGENYKATFFEDKTNLRISKENEQYLYVKNVKKAIKGINEIINDFNAHDTKTAYKIDSFEKLPENVQIVLVDMIYNLGKKGFDWKLSPKVDDPKKNDGYPEFWRQLSKRNIAGMVEECPRNKKDSRFADRNKATQELLRQTPKDWTKKALKK